MVTFQAPLVFDSTILDGYMKHYVPLPPEVADHLIADGVKRVEGIISGMPFKRSLQKRADGGYCLRFGAGIVKEQRWMAGETLRVELAADSDPDYVEIPDEMEAILAEDFEAARAWAALTPGRQRTLAYNIIRAKRAATRTKRARAALDELISGR